MIRALLMPHPAEVIHIVLWKLRKTASEEALVQAKQSIAALKTVPGPEKVCLGRVRACVSYSRPFGPFLAVTKPAIS